MSCRFRSALGPVPAWGTDLGFLSPNLNSTITIAIIAFIQRSTSPKGGVRNVAINDFRPFSVRQDQGALWENFLVAERRKRLLPGVEARFWRLRSGAEVDYVEAAGESLRAFEFKLSAKSRAKALARWGEAYPGAPWQKIDRDNYLPFIAG